MGHILRARSQEQKTERRDKILKAALQLLKTHPYQNIDMSTIAKKAQMAKGTVYLYFTTKEDLFLSLYEEEYYLWLTQLTFNSQSAEVNIASLCSQIEAHPLMIQLLCMLHSVFEHNISEKRALEFRSRLAIAYLPIAKRFESALDLPQDEGLTLLTYLSALTIGLYPMAYPAKNVQKAISANPEFKELEISFQSYLQLALTSICTELRKYR